MKTVTTWAPPIAVSLLLHVVLVVLLPQPISVKKIDTSRDQAITVELTGKTAAIESNPASPKSYSSAIALPIQETVEPQQLALVSSLPDAQVPTLSPVQKNLDKQPSAAEIVALQPISRVARPPSFLRKIEPVYPRSEQRAGSEANVLVEVAIDSNGNVLDQKIIKSAGIFFDNAVIDALKKSIFSPALIDKEPVAATVLVPFRFKLN
jgi:protein TonB